MTLANAKVLFKHFAKLGMKEHMEQLARRYPVLLEKPTVAKAAIVALKKPEKKNGKKSKR